MIARIAIFLLLTTSLMAQTWTFNITSDPVLIDPSAVVSNFDLGILGTVPGVEVAAYQFCFSYDPTQVSLFGIQSIADLGLDPLGNPQQPSFFNTFFANEVVTVGGLPYGPGVGFAACLFDFSLATTIIADTPEPLLRLQIVSAPTATPGPTDISFVNGLDLPGAFDTLNEISYLVPPGVALGFRPLSFAHTLNLFAFPKFTRGDANGNGSRDLRDAVFILEWSFLGTSTPPCIAAVDIYADGEAGGLASTLELLNYLFAGAPPPAGGVCAVQDDLGLTCDVSVCP